LGAKLLDHRVEIRLLDDDARHVHGQLLERLQREFWIDLEGSAIGEVLAAAVRRAQRLDARAACGVQLLFGDCARVRRADHVRHDLLPHLAAVVLPNDLLRHLAGAKPLEFRGLTDLSEPRGHGALDLRIRHAHRQASLQPGRRLERDFVAL
jgi:hypothetical protein